MTGGASSLIILYGASPAIAKRRLLKHVKRRSAEHAWALEVRMYFYIYIFRIFLKVKIYILYIYPAPATAGAAPPKKKAPRSECAIDTDR